MPNEYDTIKTFLGICGDVAKGGEVLGLAKNFIISFGALGGILGGILSLANPGAAGYGEQFRQIGHKLENISRKMDESINNLGSLIVEHSFTKEISQEVKALELYMRNILQYNSVECKNRFIDQCRCTSPFRVAVNMRNRLSDDITNPMLKAMEADPYKTTATFHKWRITLNSLIDRLGALEFFHIGLTREGGAAAESKQLILELMEEIKQKVDNTYNRHVVCWPNAVTKIVHETQDHNQHVGNETKADILKKKLSEMHTNDHFYIMVYNDCSGYDKHCFHYNGDQTICSFRRGKCNVVVYRSKWSQNRTNETVENDLAYIKSISEGCRAKGIYNPTSDLQMPCRSLRAKYGLVAKGLVAIIGDHDLAIRSTGHREWGPGWWNRCVHFGDGFDPRKNVTLLIGYM